MMQMLDAGGLVPVTDEIRVADEDNPRGYYELEAVKSDTGWLEGARGKVVKLISQLLLELPVGGPYKVVFMRRPLAEVLASQKKMLERRGEPPGAGDAEMTSTFAAHLEEVEAFMRERDDIESLFVSYSRLVTEPGPQLERLTAFLPGLDAAAMAAAIDPGLYRNRSS